MTAKKTTKKAAPAAKPKDAPLARVKKQPSPAPLEWEEVVRNAIWKTTTVPDGDKCTASIKRSSKNSDGSFSFYCYRNARAIAITRDFDEAKARVASGEISDKTAMMSYVRDHAMEIPPFLLLTEEERRAVRADYSHAAPTEAKMRAHVAQQGGRGAHRPGPDARDLSDPSTVRFLEAQARREAGAAAGAESTGAASPAKTTVRGGKKAALSSPGARLSLVGSPDNPGKPGSKRHAGYKIILDAAAAGSTVAEALAAGADPLRLGKCVARGLVELK